MRYDAAIIGAGADGLAAAATLAKSGLKAILLERSEKPGGRCTTREFHPGFRASPFCDELPPIPSEIFWALDLARRGAVVVPSPIITALWADRARSFRQADESLFLHAASLAGAGLVRAELDTPPKRKPLLPIGWQEAPVPWPAEEWATRSLGDLLAADMMVGDAAALTLAHALAGRAGHPDHAGSALHLLTATGSGLVVGGLQRLGDALVAATRDSGAEISCGLEVTDILHTRGKVSGVRLADGTEIAARAIISTLDFKRTFLSLFAWNDLPKDLANRAVTFRMAGSTARLLFALSRLPDRPAVAPIDLFHGPIHVAPAVADITSAYTAWRNGSLAEHLPVQLRFLFDPRLCPPGGVVMTATAGCVPLRLFDGSWTHEKRAALCESVLASVENVLPGVAACVLASEVIVPPDIEEALGCTDGDLWGGEIAADQMLSYRPWLAGGGSRTAMHGLYLAGPSTSAGVLGTCAAGALAAKAVIADIEAGSLK